MPLEMIFDKMY